MKGKNEFRPTGNKKQLTIRHIIHESRVMFLAKDIITWMGYTYKSGWKRLQRLQKPHKVIGPRHAGYVLPEAIPSLLPRRRLHTLSRLMEQATLFALEHAPLPEPSIEDMLPRWMKVI